jgi:hypothetical protein
MFNVFDFNQHLRRAWNPVRDGLAALLAVSTDLADLDLVAHSLLSVTGNELKEQ